jgi:hypothetical protein
MHGVGRIPTPNNKTQPIKHPKPTMYGCLVALMGLQHSMILSHIIPDN